MPRTLLRAALCASFLLAAAGKASAEDALDRLESLWSNLHGYEVTIVEHEVMGGETSEHELRYAFQKPTHARVEVMQGTKAGSVILWDGGDRVTAYRRNMSFFKIHGGVKDHDLTSLRGNSVLSPNMGDLLACFSGHKNALREREGPVVDGEPTDELALTYNDVSCPDDSVSDRAITLDVLDVSKKTGLIVERKRYEGETLVEHWELKDYKIEPGLGEAAALK